MLIIFFIIMRVEGFEGYKNFNNGVLRIYVGFNKSSEGHLHKYEYHIRDLI